VEGIAEACLALGVPVVGGNVSFYNETMGSGIFPTPTIAMVGLIEDREWTTVQWLSREGESLVLFGKNRGELGGSEYLRYFHGLENGRPPALDLPLELRVQEACREAARARIISSAHDCSEGGLAVALAESCITGPRTLGAEISLRSDSIRPDALLFGECQSRILLSLPRENLGRLQAIADRFGIPCEEIGRVGGDRIRVTVDGRAAIDAPVKDARRAWMSALDGILA
jgi:phosphoribosylformylglycinamidine synthase